jgi:hypothetical protein
MAGSLIAVNRQIDQNIRILAIFKRFITSQLCIEKTMQGDENEPCFKCVIITLR